MATATIRISEGLVRLAKKHSRIHRRSVTEQIEYWARLGRSAEENPDLTGSFIKRILTALQEAETCERLGVATLLH